jgi:hypothetical protein
VHTINLLGEECSEVVSHVTGAAGDIVIAAEHGRERATKNRGRTTTLDETGEPLTLLRLIESQLITSA